MRVILLTLLLLTACTDQPETLAAPSILLGAETTERHLLVELTGYRPQEPGRELRDRS